MPDVRAGCHPYADYSWDRKKEMSNENDDNVVYFNGHTTLPIPVERVIEGAQLADLKEIIVVGVGQDGQPYLASSHTDKHRIIGQLEMAKSNIVHILHAEEG